MKKPYDPEIRCMNESNVHFSKKELDTMSFKCPDEPDYNDPPTMFDENGNKLYAYVTLVMMGDRYVSGAIVLAYSIRKLGTNADLVILITHDVSENARMVLKQFYDHIIPVDYIETPNWRVKHQPHRKYLSYVFTKFHLFNLTQYKKVLFYDADALVLKYPNHLFSLNAPAGHFNTEKSELISYDNNCNYVLKQMKWYDIFCKCCKHGNVIPKHFTDEVAHNFKKTGVAAGLLLLEPKKGILEDILEDLKGKYGDLVRNKFIWPEQQYLTLKYSGQWHSINPVFFGLQGYPHWSSLYGLQYAGDKPFIFDSKIDMNIRKTYDDFIIWHKFYAELVEKYPDFKNHKCLQEANHVHSYFVAK